MSQNLKNIMGKTLYDQLDKHTWHNALLMVMSDHPEKPLSPDYESICDEFMALSNPKIPDEYIIWEPYENWDLIGIQGLIEETHDALLNYAGQVISFSQLNGNKN